MLNGKTFLAIIPARGGSKRLPRKNILELAGKPLIAWTIEAAQKSKHIDRVVVTTDDREIEEISVNWGANVIQRPANLATDTASSVDVVIHAIDHVNTIYDYVILLQPTSPLRNAHHIDEAVEMIFKKCADAIISVCEAEHSPLWCNTLPEDENMSKFIREDIKGKRSQDLPKYYRLNGAVYIADILRLYTEKTFNLTNNTFAYVMPQENSVDIDTELDLAFTGKLLEQKTT